MGPRLRTRHRGTRAEAWGTLGGVRPTGPVVLVLGSCVSLQVGAACAAQLFPVSGSTGTTLLRLGLAAALLLPLVRPRPRHWDRRQWRAVVLYGAALAAMNASFYAAIARIPLGTAVTIEFLGPLTLAAVLSRRPRDLGWVALAGTGVALLGLGAGGAAGLDPAGVGFGLLAGLFWAGYILASQHTGAVVPGQAGLAVATVVGTLLLAPAGAAGAVHAFARWDLALFAVGTGLLGSVVPYSLELAALRRLPAAVFGVLFSLEPAIAALAGRVLLGQRIGPVESVAIGVVVVASAGSTLTGRQPAADPVAPPGRLARWRSPRTT